jgi:tetratricopeptide (TPR) repeat protein
VSATLDSSPAPIESWEVLDLLTGLVQKSLVVYEEDEQGQGRYRFLETVRQYARDRLLESGEGMAVRDRHRDWSLALAEQGLLHGESGRARLDRLERELDNLRVSLEWSTEQGEAELELRLAGALSAFWVLRSHWKEGRQRLEGALARTGLGAGKAEGVPTKARALALQGAGYLAAELGDRAAARSRLEESVRLCRELRDSDLLAWSLFHLFYVEEAEEPSVGEESVALFREVGSRVGLVFSLYRLGNWVLQKGDYALARCHYEESLAIGRELEDKQALARPLAGLGNLAWRQGDYAAARFFLEESVALRREVGDSWLAGSIVTLGGVVCEQSDYGRAAALFEESLALSREHGHKWALGASLAGLGAVARHRGDDEAARSLCEQSLAVFKELEDKRGIARALTTLGWVAHAQGDDARARLCHEESLALWRELGETWGMAACLEGLAEVAGAQGHPQRAAQLFGAAERLRDGTPMPPADRPERDRSVAAVRAALGEVAFAAAWAAGRAMSLDQAVVHALEESADA